MCSEAIIYLPHNGNIAIDFVRNNEWSTNAIYIIVLLHSWRLYHQIASYSCINYHGVGTKLRVWQLLHSVEIPLFC